MRLGKALAPKHKDRLPAVYEAIRIYDLMLLFGGYDGHGLMNAPASFVERMNLVRIGTMEAEQQQVKDQEREMERKQRNSNYEANARESAL